MSWDLIFETSLKTAVGYEMKDETMFLSTPTITDRVERPGKEGNYSQPICQHFKFVLHRVLA
jgi:hypothetical protein